ncbi:MFS transporter [Isoptericola sp. b441]|uniref:MFS transporter n=1 Tax=Actinotalea lenta TaxID=3064654 RepID=A0ABT9D747_9CELL|nr:MULTISPECIES: MFS transporter [unclassified Isoptericola]MDO8106672.1 MFS transporter [Isoptericola sp. b441]MDO8121620.1 MFS transporter [Isoptericola sp. b490]
MDDSAALPASASRRLVRDRLTVALDVTFVTWGWFIYVFSPTVPLLAAEQHISRGVAGLHGTAMAVGTVATGLVSERVAFALGRKRQLYLAMAVMSIGVTLLLVGPGLAATLSACALTAVGGNLMLAATQPALLGHHGPAGPAAVTEGNAYATTVGLLAPVVLGLTVGAGYGWRPAVAVTVVAAAVATVLLAGIPAAGPLGHPTHVEDGGTRVPLGRAFRLLWVATVAGIAIEFATTFWASDLVRVSTGAPESVATGAVAALLAGMTATRFATGTLVRHVQASTVLLAGYAVAVAGWLVLWLATVPWLAVAGLALAGLGYGVHYPLALSLLLQAAGSRPDLGQARALLGAGVAIGLSPFILGSAADVVGPHTAFLLVPALAALAATCVAVEARGRVGVPV